MNVPFVSRRGFVLAGAAVSAVCSFPVLEPLRAVAASPGNLPKPQDVASDLAGLEKQMAALKPPILLMETAVPEGVSTDAGTVSISAEHAKLGDHSLLWDHQGKGGNRDPHGDSGTSRPTGLEQALGEGPRQTEGQGRDQREAESRSEARPCLLGRVMRHRCHGR